MASIQFWRILFGSISKVVTSEQSERGSYQQSYRGHLDDIQNSLKPLKKLEKIEINIHDNF